MTFSVFISSNIGFQVSQAAKYFEDKWEVPANVEAEPWLTKIADVKR